VIIGKAKGVEIREK